MGREEPGFGHGAMSLGLGTGLPCARDCRQLCSVPVLVPGDTQGSSGPSEEFVASGTGAAMRA